MQDELRRNIDAIEAFKETFVRRRAKRNTFTIGPTDITKAMEGARINTRLDVNVTETDADDFTYSGGCVMFVANIDASRRNIADRRKAVAAMIHWGLQESNPNIESLPRLCMSFDVSGGAIIKAPTAINRFRGLVVSACQEVAARWPRVAPPNGYDCPDWR